MVMLSALDENENLVSVVDGIPVNQKFTCPACHSAVRLKNGKIMRPHFAHIALNNCDFYSENESDEHLQLKTDLYHAISKTEQVMVEKVLPAINQVADLFVNHHLALEVQCSRLSEKRLFQRTKSYQNQGIQVLWLLGEKLWLRDHLSSLQRHFLYFSQNMGFHLWEIDALKHRVRLRYLIYEDLHGKVYYLTKTCSFSDDVMAFFRQPYQKQKISYYTVEQDLYLLSYIQKKLIMGNHLWLKRQEKAYLNGQNLLTLPLSSYFPQVRPFDFKEGFCQISQNLSSFYKQFYQFYQNQSEKTVQWLYPPTYYAKMVNKY